MPEPFSTSELENHKRSDQTHVIAMPTLRRKYITLVATRHQQVCISIQSVKETVSGKLLWNIGNQRFQHPLLTPVIENCFKDKSSYPLVEELFPKDGRGAKQCARKTFSATTRHLNPFQDCTPTNIPLLVLVLLSISAAGFQLFQEGSSGKSVTCWKEFSNQPVIIHRHTR